MTAPSSASPGWHLLQGPAPFQYQTLNNSVRLQPPDLCSPSGRLFILLTLLMLLFHLFWLPSFTSQEGNSSFHVLQAPGVTKSTLSHKAALDVVTSPHLQPPTNHPRKILALAFIFSLLLNQTYLWISPTGNLHRESSFPHKWIKAPGVYSEKRQRSLGASLMPSTKNVTFH